MSVCTIQLSSTNSQPKQQSSKSKNNSKSWRVSDQQTKLEKADLDSSILTPYSEYHEKDINSDNELPPTHEVVFYQNSREFQNKIFEALGLDTEKYVHVNPDILGKFEDIRKYSAAFWLLGVNLEVIKGTEHQILTRDASPSYTLPYHKCPSESSATKSNASLR